MRRQRSSEAFFHGRSMARRGSIVVVAMVALVVVTALAAGLLQRASLHRRDVQRRDWVVQSEWLAQSALSRGAAKGVADPAYREEVWEIPAEKFGGIRGGRATITVGADPDDAARRLVTVVADFPDHPSDRVRTRRSVSVEVRPAANE